MTATAPTLPTGTRFDGLTALGSSRLAVRAVLPDGREAVVLIDADSGKARMVLSTGDTVAATNASTMPAPIPHTP